MAQLNLSNWSSNCIELAKPRRPFAAAHDVCCLRLLFAEACVIDGGETPGTRGSIR